MRVTVTYWDPDIGSSCSSGASRTVVQSVQAEVAGWFVNCQSPTYGLDHTLCLERCDFMLLSTVHLWWRWSRLFTLKSFLEKSWNCSPAAHPQIPIESNVQLSIFVVSVKLAGFTNCRKQFEDAFSSKINFIQFLYWHNYDWYSLHDITLNNCSLILSCYY